MNHLSFRTYRSFVTALRTVQLHSEEILCWNQFYSPVVTLLVGVYILDGGILLNNMLTLINEVLTVYLLPWIVFAVMVLSSTFMITYTSSRTMLLNQKLYLKLINMQQQTICRRRRRSMSSARRIVLFDLVNEYKILLLKTCFRLVTSSALNNKLYFFQLFVLASIIYMKAISSKI